MCPTLRARRRIGVSSPASGHGDGAAAAFDDGREARGRVRRPSPRARRGGCRHGVRCSPGRYTVRHAAGSLDVYAYALKALEIARGELTPVRSHAIGWSFLLAPFLTLVPSASMTTVLDVARVVASAVDALTVVPVAVLARETLDRRAQLVVLALFPFAASSIQIAVGGFAEPSADPAVHLRDRRCSRRASIRAALAGGAVRCRPRAPRPSDRDRDPGPRGGARDGDCGTRPSLRGPPASSSPSRSWSERPRPLSALTRSVIR